MEAKVIGVHAGCGGDVVYTFAPSFGNRRCTRCGADGKYGRPSPEVKPKFLVGGDVICTKCGKLSHFKYSGASDVNAEAAEHLADIHSMRCQAKGVNGVAHVVDVFSEKPLAG